MTLEMILYGFKYLNQPQAQHIPLSRMSDAETEHPSAKY